MSTLRAAVDQYLEMRRGLGFKLENQGLVLRNFVRFAESEKAHTVTTDLLLRWSKQPNKAGPATWAHRVGMMRTFASWYSTHDPGCEVPPHGLLPQKYRRQQPYIYSGEEIGLIVAAATELPSSRGLRGLTHATFFALMAATGMRIGEALALDRNDVDLDDGVLTIRHAKFGKSRLLPLHPTTTRALKNYASRRNQILGRTSPPAFFVSDSGKRLTQWGARYNFARVSQAIGIRLPAQGHGRGPRLHDLRHRFAVKALIGWYQAGANVEAEIPRLATYLGHVHVSDTFWYIEGVPELLQLATERLQRASEVACP